MRGAVCEGGRRRALVAAHGAVGEGEPNSDPAQPEQAYQNPDHPSIIGWPYRSGDAPDG